MKRVMLEGLCLSIILSLGLGVLSLTLAQTPLILSLGEDSYLPKSVIEASTGAKFLDELGNKKLGEVQLIVLSNIDYSSLPGSLQDGLGEYVQNGGALLIAGGARSYGSGGFGNTNLAGILPFQILYPRDWQPTRIGDIVPLDKGHAVFAGIDFLKMPMINQFNNLGWQPAAHGIAKFSKFEQQPLIAERNVGGGTILGIAFNMADAGSIWPQASRFCLNLTRYLLQKSTIPVR
jgi:uncharacterized membrane protein